VGYRALRELAGDRRRERPRRRGRFVFNIGVPASLLACLHACMHTCLLTASPRLRSIVAVRDWNRSEWQKLGRHGVTECS
jgi:hypothetical protein